VHKLWNTFLSGSMAAMMILLAAGTHQFGRAQNPPAKKNYKDNGEADLYNKVAKDAAGKDWKSTITDLDAWKAKYANSDFKDDREVFYIQAYSGTADFAKAVESASPLIDRGLDKVFDDPKIGPTQQLMVLFTTVQAVTQVKNPSPEQLAIGDKAAHQLYDLNRKPDGVGEADWEKVRTSQLQPSAKATMLWIALQPGAQAMAKNDYPGAEAAFSKALNDYPQSAAICYNLALSLSKQGKKVQALYEFERAIVIDPTLGGTSDAAKMKDFADKYYVSYHGSNEGLDQLKETVKASPLPPADFKVKTATEVADEKEAEFEKSNPQLAMWMKIKGALADTNGEQYFDTSLKNAAVPKLKGILVEAKPACRPKELLVAVPLPDAKTPYQAEISLKLVDADDKPATLSGKPEANSEFQWEGVPSAFTKEPTFLLTMDTDKTKVDGLKVTPCAPTPAHRTVTRKK
jgi:tetratricopeptide (TPR) repeat protein